jgi:uncharacterized damage-inducible protein DinB
MSEPALTATEMLAWNDQAAANWHALIERNPQILTLPCDIYKPTREVAGLLQHVVAVELRYAQRLAGVEETPYEDVPSSPVAAIFAVHARALAMIRALLADPAYDWSIELTFNTISAGRLRATRKTILVHASMHSIRHYAQLATLVRHHGLAPGFPMDYLMMDAHPA